MSLNDKIISFLEKEMLKAKDEYERNNRLEVINYFKNSEGQCYSMAFLQAYGRKIEDENKQKKSSKVMDDSNFFKNTKDLLLNWNESDELSEENKSDIERFISNILCYQQTSVENKIKDTVFDSYEQDFSKIFEDTLGRKFIKEYKSSSAILNEDALEDRISKIISCGSIVFIALKDSLETKSGHIVAIYQNQDGQIYFFNNEEEYLFNDTKELTKEIWLATDPKRFRNNDHSFISDSYLRIIEKIEVFELDNSEKKENNIKKHVSEDIDYIPKHKSILLTNSN